MARSAGAISKTEFTVTATVAGDDPNENCEGDSADSKTGEDGANTAALTLVDTTFDTGTCEYDITAALPAGFVADDDSNVAEDVDPLADAEDDNNPDTDEDNIDDNQILTVSVASVNVYLVQNVTGDAGGASAAYSGFESSCGGPDELNLPGNLKAERSGPSSTSGIYSTEGVTLVELRSGRYNITAALNDRQDRLHGQDVLCAGRQRRDLHRVGGHRRRAGKLHGYVHLAAGPGRGRRSSPHRVHHRLLGPGRAGSPGRRAGGR